MRIRIGSPREQELRAGAGEVAGVRAEEHPDTPVDPELADGSEPLVYSAVAQLLGIRSG